jgi:hypothetical protein
MKGAYMITDIDINDFDVLPVRELYKVRPRSYVQVPLGDVFFFDHIDGAYSYCLNMFGDKCNLAAWQSVHPLVKKDNTPSPESDIADLP